MKAPTKTLKEMMAAPSATAEMKISYARYLESACPHKQDEIKTMYKEVSQNKSAPLPRLCALIALGERDLAEPQIDALIEKQVIDHESVLTVYDYLSLFAKDRAMDYLTSTVARLDTVIKSEPNNASHYYTRGLCYYRLKNIYEAEMDCAKATQLAPNVELYKIDLSYILQIQNRTEDSKKFHPSTVPSKYICDYLKVLIARAENYFKTNKFQEHLEIANILLALDPENIDIKIDQIISSFIQKKDHANIKEEANEALNKFSIIQKDHPNNAKLYTSIAAIHYGLKEVKLLTTNLLQALKLGYNRGNIDSCIQYAMRECDRNDPTLFELLKLYAQSRTYDLDLLLQTTHHFRGEIHAFRWFYDLTLKHFPDNKDIIILKAIHDVCIKEEGYKLRADALLESYQRQEITLKTRVFLGQLADSLASEKPQGKIMGDIKYHKLAATFYPCDHTYHDVILAHYLKNQYEDAWMYIKKLSSINTLSTMNIITGISHESQELREPIAALLAKQNTLTLHEDRMRFPMLLILCHAISLSTKLYNLEIFFPLDEEQAKLLNATLLTNKSIKDLRIHFHHFILPALKHTTTIENVHFINLTPTQQAIVVANKLDHLDPRSQKAKDRIVPQQRQMIEIINDASEEIPLKAFTVLQFNMYKKPYAYNTIFNSTIKHFDNATQTVVDLKYEWKVLYINACEKRLTAWKIQNIPVLISDLFNTPMEKIPNDIMNAMLHKFSIDDVASLMIKASLFVSEIPESTEQIKNKDGGWCTIQ